MSKMRKDLMLLAMLSIGGLASPTGAQEKSVEVVHWWTSGGEAAALKVLKDEVGKHGYGWKDSPIAGGGGDQERIVLRARVTAGNPPDAVQLLGATITGYANEGLLGNIDAVAQKEGWAQVVPLPLQKFAKHKGHWVAAPVNVHRTNWIWANKAIFDELKLTPPATFDDLVALADTIRQAGYIPLAHGGQPWQDATLFDNAVMSAGGPKFYKQALIDLDPKALRSKTMEKAFEQMQKLRTLVDPHFAGRDWNLATAMVIHKKAAMQIMGDWAKGEFVKAGKKPNVDYLCFQYPGTAGTFIFLSDQFASFKVKAQQRPGQMALARSIMDRDVQEKFSLLKGSIPARTDVPMDKFDDCGKQSMVDLTQAMRSGTLLGSFAYGHAMPEATKEVVKHVVSQFFNSDQSPAQATRQLASAVAHSL